MIGTTLINSLNSTNSTEIASEVKRFYNQFYSFEGTKIVTISNGDKGSKFEDFKAIFDSTSGSILNSYKAIDNQPVETPMFSNSTIAFIKSNRGMQVAYTYFLNLTEKDSDSLNYIIYVLEEMLIANLAAKRVADGVSIKHQYYPGFVKL